MTRPSCVPSRRLLPALDAGDLDLGQLLTVTLTLVVTGLVLELVDPDLRALGVGHDLTGDRERRELVGLVGDVLAVDHEQRRQGEGVARLALELLDLDDVAHGHLVLLAAGLDDGVHRRRSPDCSEGVDLVHAPAKALPRGRQERGARHVRQQTAYVPRTRRVKPGW